VIAGAVAVIVVDEVAVDFRLCFRRGIYSAAVSRMILGRSVWGVWMLYPSSAAVGLGVRDLL